MKGRVIIVQKDKYKEKKQEKLMLLLFLALFLIIALKQSSLYLGKDDCFFLGLQGF